MIMEGSGTNEDPYRDPEHIHGWFGLSYANYLVMPRSLLQSMPNEWQEKFVNLLGEFNKLFGNNPDLPDSYLVKPKGENGKFISDKLGNYDRGRERIKPIKN